MDTNIDLKAKALTQAIRRAETGGSADPYNTRGASGEFGAYQFTPTTYSLYAKRYLGNADAEPTVENQNRIAYSFVKEKKDDGFNPAQIASMWNAGEALPNAYRENWKGTNDFGVKYDTPAYAAKVSNHYKELSAQLVPTAQASTGVQTKEPAIGASPVGLGKIYGQAIVGSKNATQVAGGIDKIVASQRELLSRRNKAANEGRDTSKLDTALAQTNKILQELGGTVQDVATAGISTKDVVGATLGTLAYLPVGFGASKVASAIGGGGTLRNIASGVASGAISGAGGGALGNAGDALTRDESVVGGAVTGGLIGGALGGVLGGAVPIIGATGSALGRAVKGNVAPKFDDVAQQYADNILTNTKSSRRTTSNFEKTNGLKPQNELVRRGITPTVKNGGAYFADGIAQVENELDQFDETIGKVVDRYKNLRVEEEQIIDRIESVLKSDPALKESGNVGSTRKLAREIFEGYKDDYGRSTFTLDEIQAFKKAQYKQANRFKVGANPNYEKADGHTIIAKAFKEIIENNIDDVAIKELNQEYGRAIALIDYMAKMNGSTVKGGKLGNYFLRGVGAVSGAQGGVLGSIIGATTGDAFANVIQRYSIFGPLKERYIAQVGQGFKNEVLEQTIKYLDDVEKGLAPAVPKAVREQIIADLMAMPKALPAAKPGAPRVEFGSGYRAVEVPPGGFTSTNSREYIGRPD